MKENKAYHLLFWLFVFLYVFDHIVAFFPIHESILYTLIELVIYAFAFYINLHILLPRVFTKFGTAPYIGSIIGLLLFEYGPYFFFGLGQIIITGTEVRIFYSFSINYMLFIMISFLYWYVGQYRIEQSKRLTLENEKLKAELLLLKSHVSPHFLFNSLNNIYSLIVANNDNAAPMVEKLSDYLRYIIYEGERERVPLEKEVELIRNYIDLQLFKKLKGEDNIELEIDGVEQYQQIAPLILINMVENCFKHGDVVYNADGFIHVRLKVEGNQLHFSTSNSYKKKTIRNGIGVQSTPSTIDSQLSR